MDSLLVVNNFAKRIYIVEITNFLNSCVFSKGVLYIRTDVVHLKFYR